VTIIPLDSEVYSPSVDGDENGVLQDTLNSGAASADLADLLDDQMVALLAERARAQAAEGGLKLLGDGGLLQAITKRVIEAALEGEMAEHLDTPADGGPGASRNERNGKRRKKVMTEVGTVEIAVPRDRAGSFTPEVVAKRKRRTSGIDELVVSLTARGLTTGEIAAST
jgi:putative transposase